MTLHLRIFAIALAAALSAGAAQAATCDPAAVSRASLAVRGARADLLTLPDGGGGETTVPPRGKPLIAAMKARLGDFVLATLACRPGDDLKALLKALSAAAVRNDKPTDHPYGDSVAFDVRRVADKLVVSAGFSIECANDTVLMVFARANGAWREVLRYQTGPYDEVSGGLDSYHYEISPPDRAGNWFLVEHNVLGWCQSTWSTIHYAVLRPSGDTLKPRVLLDASDPIWWGNEDFGRLQVGATDFTLRFHAESIDPGIHNREWVRHFSIIGDTAIRIPPLANTPREFAEEWIQADWKTVAPWTADPALKSLQAKLHKGDLGFEFRSVRRCAGVVRRMQVEIAEGYDHPVLHYLAVADAGAFKMLSARMVADPACKGPNLFDMNNPG